MGKKFLYGLVTLYVLLCSCTSKVSDKEYAAKNDSIKKYLDLAGNYTLDIKLRKKYNDKAFALVDLNKNDTIIRYYLSRLSYNYVSLKNKKELFSVGKIHFEKSTIARDTLNLARYYRYKAGYYKNTFVNDSAFYYYLKAEKFYKRTDDELGLGNVFLYKGIVQMEIFDLLGAEITLYKAYDIFKKQRNYKKQCSVLNQLGLVYMELSEFQKATKSFEKILQISEKLNSKDALITKATSISNNGLLLYRQQKFVKAIDKFEKALRMIEDKKSYKLLYSNTLDNLIDSKMRVGIYDNSLESLNECLKLRIELNDPSNIAFSYINLSQYYNYKNQKKLAEKYAQMALTISAKTKNKLYYLNSLNNIRVIDKKYIQKYFEEYVKINQEFQMEERNARNNFARIAYETQEISQEKDNAINQKWIVVIVSSFIILIIALLLIIAQQRNRQKELALIQFQQRANEEIYDLMLTQSNKEAEARQQEKKRIALELHDGVMNKLASTRMNLHVLRHKRDERTIQECLNHIDEIYNVEQEIRNISHDLSFDIFENSNTFKDILSDFINSQNKTHRTIFKLEMDDFILWEAISSVIKINLFRIVQEGCANINKFAEANTAIVTLLLDKENLCLSITDDGKGFDVEKSFEGIGLRNIEQRVKQLSGKFLIQSNDKGVSLNISVPLV